MRHGKEILKVVLFANALLNWRFEKKNNATDVFHQLAHADIENCSSPNLACCICVQFLKFYCTGRILRVLPLWETTASKRFQNLSKNRFILLNAVFQICCVSFKVAG